MSESDAANAVDRARSWLRTEGYALEYETAEWLRKASFNARQGVTYVSDSTRKRRDVDVLAEMAPLALRPAPTAPAVVVAVECKTDKDHEWIVRKSRFADGPPWRPIASQDVIDHLERMNRSMPWLDLDDLPGFDVVQTRSKSNIAFATLDQAVSSAVGVLGSYSSALVHPVVILDGALVSLRYDAEGAEQIHESQWERVVFSGASDFHYPATVDIITRSALGNRVMPLRRDLERLQVALGTRR